MRLTVGVVPSGADSSTSPVDQGVEMSLRKRAMAVVVVSAAAFTALAPQAMAAPMPWETSKSPATATHHSPATTPEERAAVTVLCGSPCYQ